MTINFEELLHKYIPLAQKDEFLNAHPGYLELKGKDIEEGAIKGFVEVALAYLGLLGTGITTPDHQEPVAESVAAVAEAASEPAVAGETLVARFDPYTGAEIIGLVTDPQAPQLA